jgi:hypothetical protein
MTVVTVTGGVLSGVRRINISPWFLRMLGFLSTAPNYSL